MKLFEIAPSNRNERLAALKKAVDSGMRPEVVEAGAHAGKFAMGDLEQLGYAKNHERPVGRGTVEFQWEYTGPNTIVCNGREMKAGDMCSPVEVDFDEREDEDYGYDRDGYGDRDSDYR